VIRDLLLIVWVFDVWCLIVSLFDCFVFIVKIISAQTHFSHVLCGEKNLKFKK